MTRTMFIAILAAGCTSSASNQSVIEQQTTVCPGSNLVHGMDVSSYETSIDWTMAKGAGIDFAFIRVSDGLQYRDPKFASYWAGARAAGVMRGAYQFFRPTQDAIAQADLLLAATAPQQPGDLPPTIDVETTGGLAQEKVEAAVRTWVDHVTAVIGRPPIVYAGYYSWQDYTGNANLTASPLWHAQYTNAPCPNIPTPWTRWTFWQHSATGVVPGVVGEPTDLNVFDGTLAELQAFAGKPAAVCGTVPSVGGVIDDTDRCFSAGGPAASLRHATDVGANGSLLWTRATASKLPSNFAQWSLVFAQAGRYRLEVYTTSGHAQAKHAIYKVRAVGVTHEISLDQSAVDGWQVLAEMSFAAGGGQHVELDDNTGEPGAEMVFDAIKLTRLDALDPSTPEPEPEAATSSAGGCAATSATSTGTLLWFAIAVLGVDLRSRRQRSRGGNQAIEFRLHDRF
jgi:GH25 family lysozyme M1 (1,4-beta-N-acetylmuramidase)